MVRLFVAIDLPSRFVDQLLSVVTVLCSSQARLSIVGRESYHITLKFIGEVQEPKVNEIIVALDKVKSPSLNLNIGSVTPDNNKRPRVIWSDIDDEENRCRALVKAIDESLLPLGIPKEKRAFHPHITIARVKQFHVSLLDVLERIPECKGAFESSEFVLKKSELTPSGPIYTDLSYFFPGDSDD